MESLRSAAAVICFLGIAFSIAEGFLPDEKFKGEYKLLFLMMLIVLAVKPFLSGKIAAESDIAVTASENISESAYEYGGECIKKAVSDNIARTFESMCREKNISAEISADINISDDGSISINRVKVMADSDEMTEAAIRLIQSETGGDFEIISGDDVYAEDNKKTDLCDRQG